MKTNIRSRTIGASALLLTSTALVACGAAPDQGSADPSETEPPAATKPAASNSPTEPPPSTTPIASVTKNDHVVQFFEASPGVGAVVETSPLNEKPLVTQLGTSTLTEVFQSLSNDPVPEALVQADAARTEHMGTVAPLDAATAVKATQGGGQQFYNSGEQTWFRNTFCNGAEVCSQGWGWATTGNVGHDSETFIAMDGIEGGSVNANFWIQYWKPQPTFLGVPIACGSGSCGWIPWLNIVVVPGHYVTENVWGAPDFQAGINAGSGTQVSIAARH